MRVQAAVARVYGAALAIEDLELEEPRPGEILVRMIASGVCALDCEAVAGALTVPLPFVPGCEGAGIVERVGDGVTSPVAGEAVLIAPSMGSTGSARHSGSTAALAGSEGAVHGFFFGQSSFATHLLCDARSAVSLPEEAPLELLAGIGREVLHGAGLVLQELAVESGSTIVITGADATGLGACMAASAAGCASVILADPRADRRALALEVGATIAVPADEGLGSVVLSLSADGARYALDTSGAPAARSACEASLSANGRFIAASVDNLSTLDTPTLIRRLARLHADNRLPLEKLVDYYPFERVNEALAARSADMIVKPVLRFSLGTFGDLDRALQEGAALENPDKDPSDTPDPTDAERATPTVVTA